MSKVMSTKMLLAIVVDVLTALERFYATPHHPPHHPPTPYLAMKLKICMAAPPAAALFLVHRPKRTFKYQSRKKIKQ